METSATHPRLLRRLASVLRGEVPATELEALRAAGRGVYQAYLDAEQMQVELAGQGTHPFLASRVQRTQLLCTWNAYVLQVLGEALIDGDYRASPVTVGYLPPVTFEQSWACLAQVEPWLARCRRAMDDPSYDLAAISSCRCRCPRGSSSRTTRSTISRRWPMRPQRWGLAPPPCSASCWQQVVLQASE